MKKKISPEFLLSLAVCLIPFAISGVFYNRLPEQMAIHFDMNGAPDSYASKFFAAFGIPLLLFFLHIVTWFMLASDPKKQNSSAALKRISRWMLPVLAVAVQALSVAYALGYEINLVHFVMPLLGLIFIMFGNYLPKCRQNYTVGIKLPWTLDDEENWNKTHRMAGYLWTAGGFAVFVNTFFGSFKFLIVIVAVLAIAPMIFSYFLYSNKNERR